MGTTETFSLRKLLDPQRQSSQDALFRQLLDALAGFPMPHPYELSTAARAHLLQSVTAFAGVASPWPASPDAAQHLFRICTIGALVRGSDWRFRTNDPEAFDAVFARYHTAGIEWMPLSWFAAGALQNYRGFTWWSSLDLTIGEPWNLWRRIGLLDDWVTQHSVILRINAAMRPVMVPSCVDAFDGPVFESVRDKPTQPEHGRTIDLSQRPFGPGATEYVIGPIATSLIELRPLLVTKDMKGQGSPVNADDATTWASLETYYTELLNA